MNETGLKNIFSKVLFVFGLISLMISIIQLYNSNITDGILSLFYTGIFWMGGIHNKFLINYKLSGEHKNSNQIIFSSLMLGIFIGGTCTYLIFIFVI